MAACAFTGNILREATNTLGNNFLEAMRQEDEPLIRMGAVVLIEDAGFEVYEAGSADDAIALLEVHTYLHGCRHAWLDGRA